MDSMFSTATFRVSVPPISPNDALLPSRTPSTSTAVPKAAFPPVAPPSLSEKAFSDVRSGFTVLPPGSRAAISVVLDSWRWFRASRPMFWVVPRPSLAFWAVTTTSSRASEFSWSVNVSPSTSFCTSMTAETVTYPRHETSRTYSPFCTFSKTKLPSASVMAQR